MTTFDLFSPQLSIFLSDNKHNNNCSRRYADPQEIASDILLGSDR
ncbi:MAG: hypothetical protein QNJ54_06455 [Prochloraceae cyanobacterium]|nr:hypothetical protein [Prochloraceae cyanobacterium]